jgi:hypothetical protein
MARAVCAAFTCAVRASTFSMRSISRFTRFNAAENTLLALQRMLRRGGKARPPGGALASDLAASGQCQRARFVTEVAQLLPKGLEVIDPAFVDLGMVAAAYQLVFFETEYATFELARY